MTRVYNNYEGEPALRRYSTRLPYAPDRCLPPAQSDGRRYSNQTYHLVHDAARNEVDSEPDSTKAPNRRRIPVACGRCRKRKIRCSGPGKDTGCTNCTNAGNGECQFNRVQSEEIPLRDNTAEFGYNADIARAVQCRNVPTIAYGSQASSYPQSSGLMPLNISLAYRSHALSNYGYQNKSDYYVPTYGTDYNDESVDYNLPATPYPLLGHDQVGMSPSYNAQTSPRVWVAGSGQGSKSSTNSMYFDPEMTRSYHGLQYTAHNYAIQQAVNAEANNFSFSHMASSLPTASTVTSNDRVLPVPSNNRSNSVATSALGTLARSAEALPYSSHAVKNGNTVIQNSAASMSYMPLSSSPESVSYGSHGLNTNLNTHHQELYNTANSDGWAAGVLQNESSLRSQDSSSDLYYTANSGDSSRKASQGGQSGVNSTLSNGQVYHVPFQADPTLSRDPSMDMTNALAHRSSNASLRAQ